MRIIAACLGAILAQAAVAGTCPPAPDHSVELARLIEELRDAPSQGDAILIINRMWGLWAEAPDAEAQEMLDRGMERRGAADYAAALEALDGLVAYCPGYAEGFNQRAFVRFLMQDYETAVEDLNRALELSPTHLGALTGRALSLMALGRDHEAQADLGVALGLNPWLPERNLYRGGAPGPGESDL